LPDWLFKDYRLLPENVRTKERCLMVCPLIDNAFHLFPFLENRWVLIFIPNSPKYTTISLLPRLCACKFIWYKWIIKYKDETSWVLKGESLFCFGHFLYSSWMTQVFLLYVSLVHSGTAHSCCMSLRYTYFIVIT